MNVIVTTTINPPTPALKLFAQLPNWTLVIVGDKKTPHNLYAEELPNAVYLSPEDQEQRCKALSDLIGWNCIQRRNFGFLWAKDHGAQVVGIVDDDNIPLTIDWGSGLCINQPLPMTEYVCDQKVFDPIGATNYPHLWHRGYPLPLLAVRDYSSSKFMTITAGVQADFWDGDPDIDAICRMQFRPDCSFDHSCFPFTSDKVSPFNSQNTFLDAQLLEEYFLFPSIGRMDDIWASYYLQIKTGTRVVYNKPSVRQVRNEHNLITDMKNEFLGYEKSLEFVEAIQQDPKNLRDFIPAHSLEAFHLYQQEMKK